MSGSALRLAAIAVILFGVIAQNAGAQNRMGTVTNNGGIITQDGHPVDDAPVPALVPVMLSPADLNALIAYAAKLPYEQAAPIVNFLTAKEAEAQRAHTMPAKP